MKVSQPKVSSKNHKHVVTGAQCLNCVESGAVMRNNRDTRGWRHCLDKKCPPRKVSHIHGTWVEADWGTVKGDWTPDQRMCPVAHGTYVVE